MGERRTIYAARALQPGGRPNFSPYILGETDATSVQDYLDRYEVGRAPAVDRLYAGLVSNQANRASPAT